MKKSIRILSLLLVTLLFSTILFGCGNKTVGEEKIKQDIISKGMNLRGALETKLLDEDIIKVGEIVDFTIDKRQTNSKTDLIYGTISFYSNDDFLVKGNYALEYGLYDDGWILDSVNMESDYTVSYEGEITEETMLGLYENGKNKPLGFEIINVEKMELDKKTHFQNMNVTAIKSYKNLPEDENIIKSKHVFEIHISKVKDKDNQYKLYILNSVKAK